MLTISFNFEAKSLTKFRNLKIETHKLYGRNRRYAIPNDSIYSPVRKFLQDYKTRYEGHYLFQMHKLLHVTAVRMLAGKLKSKEFDKALFATGGLYLALDQQHASLSIDRSFGDFTSGFSHQFGVALAVMAMSEAYKIPWDQLVAIPVRGKPTLDYEIKLPNNSGWLRLEAKGTTTKSRSSLRRSAYGKKLMDPNDIASAKANPHPDPTAMVGVITQTARNASGCGVIEIIDPEFETNPQRRQPNNQLAGRYLHYAGVARFAGLNGIAEDFVRRAQDLIDGKYHSNRHRRRFVINDLGFQYDDHRLITGVQWRLGDNNNSGSEIWFYQGADINILNKVLNEDFPETEPYVTRGEENHQEHDLPASHHSDHVESILPDGSYFGVGFGPHPDLLRIDRREDGWNENRIGRLMRQ